MTFIPLEVVVNDLCELMGDYDHKKYVQVLKSVVRKMQHFNYFNQSPYYITVPLVVSNIRTVNTPADCIKPIKVGLCINGQIRSFYYNSDICPPTEDNFGCTCPTQPTGNTTALPDDSICHCGFCSFPNYFCNGQTRNFYEDYSVRPYQTVAGYFNYDLQNERIIFSSDSNVQPEDEVLLMYKSSMQSKDKVKAIPVEYFEYLRYSVMEELGDVRMSARNKREAERQEQKIIKSYNRLTAEEWEAAISGYKYSAPKR